MSLFGILFLLKVLPQRATKKRLTLFSVQEHHMEDIHPPQFFEQSCSGVSEKELILAAVCYYCRLLSWSQLRYPLYYAHFPFISDYGTWIYLKPDVRKIRDLSITIALPPMLLDCHNRTTAEPRLRLPFPGSCWIPKHLVSLPSSFFMLIIPWLYRSTLPILLSVPVNFDRLYFDFTHHHGNFGIFPLLGH